MTNQTGAQLSRNKPAAFFGGAAIGTFGGLIGPLIRARGLAGVLDDLKVALV